jgi:hypothetical protein
VARIFKRNCEQCGVYYEGYGARFHSDECANLNRRTRDLPGDTPAKPFDIEALPDERPEIGELLERRKKQYARKEKAKAARKLIPVDIRIDGPFGVAHFGDPHVDDDGTDISLLERHLNAVNATEGMFAGNVGDYANNWVGRLGHLYGQQSASAQEAWVLVEWLIGACDWLYLIGGNHDAWSGAGDPLKWIAGQQKALLEPNGARMGLRTPNGRTVRLNARHDWPGHSQWNPAHGVAKAAQMGHADHILTCGHTHVSGYQVVKQPTDGMITHAIQVSSYKVFDRYAEEKALRDQSIFMCPATIVDPSFPDTDPRFITFMPDVEEACEYLTWKRSRKTAAA